MFWIASSFNRCLSFFFFSASSFSFFFFFLGGGYLTMGEVGVKAIRSGPGLYTSHKLFLYTV